MNMEHHPVPTRPAHSSDAEVIAFLAGRAVPCPRCAYDLRDNASAQCPECGERLELKLDSSRVRFGWLVFAMVPGCFSGVAAVFVAVPIVLAALRRISRSDLPWPVVLVDIFGFASAASVVLMYRHRHRFMSWTTRRQRAFAGIVWLIHILMFGVFVLAMSFLT